MTYENFFHPTTPSHQSHRFRVAPRAGRFRSHGESRPSQQQRAQPPPRFIHFGLLRLTKGEDLRLKQCDVDSIPEMLPQTICDWCKRPVALMEFHRRMITNLPRIWSHGRATWCTPYLCTVYTTTVERVALLLISRLSAGSVPHSTTISKSWS